MPDRRAAWSPSFRHVQARRVAVRWIVMEYAIRATVFWAAALLGAAWLVHAGAWFVLLLAAAAWLYLALPGILLHALLILDLAIYAVAGRVLVYPALLTVAEAVKTGPHAQPAVPPRDAARSIYARLSRFASTVSPTIAVATWALVVLDRVPRSAHMTVPAPDAADAAERRPMRRAQSEMRHAIYTGRRMERSMVDSVFSHTFARV